MVHTKKNASGVIFIVITSCFLLSCKSNLDSLVEHPVEIIKVADGFRFTEGPAVNSIGYLYFSDIPNNKIYKWTPETGLAQVSENVANSNGLYFNRGDELLACEMKARRISRMNKDGEMEVITDEYEGKKYNKPNDLWVHPGGGIYFTDPSYYMIEADIEQDVEAVYYIPPGRDTVVRVSGHLPRPNGIVGTADGRILYVVSDTIHRTWKFIIQPDGSLSEKDLFVENGHDGLTLDARGNLYIANRDSLSVDIYNPEGEFLESIVFPEEPSNSCFGRPGDNTLYVTAVTSVYAVRMNVGGQWD